MEAFVWTPRFETGIESVDKQHRHLVDIVNRVGDLLIDIDGKHEQDLQQTFKQLADYARFHFADEERVMREAGLDATYIEEHVARHRDFTGQVLAMWHARAGMSNPTEALHGFLSAWLTFHILGEDQSMARQLRRLGEHMTPAQAHALESADQDTPTAALLEALQNLYGVLALQNRDLANANRQLEVKVAERTRELVQSEKMASIGQLAAGLAHEINNPLGFVMSNFGTLTYYVEQLLRFVTVAQTTAEGQRLAAEIDVAFLRDDLHTLIKESRAGLERVGRIVADLKDFSRLDQEGFQDVDLLAGLESTLKVVSHALGEKTEIVRRLKYLPPVRCIPSQINLVLMNLIINAAQAIADAGTITLSSGIEHANGGDEVWIEVADSGCGMDEATRNRLFEPFFTTKPVGKGTGLGLSVTWDIVKNHQGRITVDSAPGQGSRFRVCLPVRGPGQSAKER